MLLSSPVAVRHNPGMGKLERAVNIADPTLRMRHRVSMSADKIVAT
jgi:hypothetical protein